jgi:hypothetical protein
MVVVVEPLEAAVVVEPPEEDDPGRTAPLAFTTRLIVAVFAAIVFAADACTALSAGDAAALVVLLQALAANEIVANNTPSPINLRIFYNSSFEGLVDKLV